MGRFASIVAMVMLMLASAGCIRSKVLVTSEPTGAVVTMNGSHLGTTPVERPFTWYWFYDIDVQKEGFEPSKVRKRFRPPIYLWPGLDFFCELIPVNIHNTKKVHFALEPSNPRPDPMFVDTPPMTTASAGSSAP